jgi:RND superfamily putative drug exporter
MLLSGSAIFYGIALAAMIVVLVAVVGSLTVLPALMSLLGDRIERGRIPYLSRLRHAERDSRVWGFVLDRSLAHPVAAVLVAGGLLVGLSVPALDMRTATPGASDLPQDLPVMQTFARIGQHFPGGPTPAVAVVEAADVSAPAVTAGIEELRRQALATGKVNEPVRVQLSEDRSVAMVWLPLVGDGEDAASQDALRVLRERVLPATVGAVEGTTVGVTGMTAGTVDFNDLMRERAPLVFAFVLGLSFLLLVLFFRSLVVAAKAIALNLLSVSAAYGVLVLVFQHGWGEQLLDFESTGSIAAWLPLFLFVVLFGLSMDYHVFILSRVKEGVDRGLSTAEAVSVGIRTTAGTVTAAATVMVFVFLTFATLSQVSMKQLGVGLATAVLLDATLVRGVLLPASMRLLGEWNWYLPRWLSWLPDVRQEAAPGLAVPAPRTDADGPVPTRV